MKSKITICDNCLQVMQVVMMMCMVGLVGLSVAADPYKFAPSTGGIPNDKAGTNTGLINPNATAEARGLMRYLSAVYGSNVLSGHQTSYTYSTAESELAKIKQWTGETPAMRGFDFMDVINSWGAPHAQKALEWGRDSGGIVHMCWHWRLGGGSFNNSAFPDSPETDATINADLKKLGDELEKFATAKVPIVWRPLHEPPGKWFWWHNGGADKFKRLWVHMYKYLVNDRKLNNLIWVYSSSDGGTYSNDWYPGNSYVDIIGVDGYGEEWQKYWNGLWSMTGGGKKMAAMTENKKFPPWNNNTPWLFTLGWNNEIFNALGENDFKGHYNHVNTINFDDLPTSKNPATGKPRATWDKMLYAPISSSSSVNSSSSVVILSSSSVNQSSSSVVSSSSATNMGDFVVLEDFNDDATSQTTMGANLGVAAHAGYWYGFTDADHGGTSVIVPDVVVADTRFEQAVVNCEGSPCLNFKINLGSGYGYPYAALGFNIKDEGEEVDLSEMTKMTFRAKGSGILRVKFMTARVTDGYPKGSNWGDMGKDITLTNTWTTYEILVADIKPQPGSVQATDKLTWDDCKDKVRKIHLQTGPTMKAGQSLEVWIDDLVWHGVSPQTFGGSWIENPVSVKHKVPRIHTHLIPTRWDMLGRRMSTSTPK